jgi:hypothetical protein
MTVPGLHRRLREKGLRVNIKAPTGSATTASRCSAWTCAWPVLVLPAAPLRIRPFAEAFGSSAATVAGTPADRPRE